MIICVLRGSGQQGELFLADPGAPEPVDGLAAGRGGQPAAAVRRHVAAPVLEGLDERVLHGVLGQADVAQPRGERGPDPAGLLAVGPLKLNWYLVHAPVKLGGRLAANEASPSAKSAEDPISRWIPASNSSWASICSYSQRFSWRLVPA